MTSRSLVVRAAPLTAAAVLVAVSYGISFPLLGSRVERTGVTGLWIGLNAAAPALGWIVGSAIVPLLMLRLAVTLRAILLGLVALGLAALAALALAEDYATMTGLRLAFGGALGVFFRTMEYWINGLSGPDDRGRNLGLYSVLFMVALVAGSALQPALGGDGAPAFAPPVSLLAAAMVLLLLWSGAPAPAVRTEPQAAGSMSPVLAVPAALLAVLAYSLYEAVPTSLLQVYALRNGVRGDTAALCLAAAALGHLLLLYPVAALSDRIGRVPPLVVCTATAAFAAAALPATLTAEGPFLATVALLGGAAGSTYALALAMIGDRFEGAALVLATAAFGLVYAAGCLVGPLLGGLAIDQLGPHGLTQAVALTFAATCVAIVVLKLLPIGRRSP